MSILFAKILSDKHKIFDCIIHTLVRVEVTNKKMESTNYSKQIKNSFVIYADFESTLDKVNMCEPNPSEPFSNKIQNIHRTVFVYILNVK